jgi:hypothetical protein
MSVMLYFWNCEHKENFNVFLLFWRKPRRMSRSKHLRINCNITMLLYSLATSLFPMWEYTGPCNHLTSMKYNCRHDNTLWHHFVRANAEQDLFKTAYILFTAIFMSIHSGYFSPFFSPSRSVHGSLLLSLPFFKISFKLVHAVEINPAKSFSKIHEN